MTNTSKILADHRHTGDVSVPKLFYHSFSGYFLFLCINSFFYLLFSIFLLKNKTIRINNKNNYSVFQHILKLFFNIIVFN